MEISSKDHETGQGSSEGNKIYLVIFGILALFIFIVCIIIGPSSDEPYQFDRESRQVRLGQIVDIRQSTVCAPTKEALDRVWRWVGIDETEFYREIGKTGSVVIGPGDKAKVIDAGILRHQIRLANGEECWIWKEALEP